MERDEQIAVFLKPDEAVALLRSNNRGIAALTYGWVTPDHPDETDEYLANMRRFLNHPLGAHIGDCFWDFGSLPQRPRSAEEAKGFKVALGCMGDVYASAMGTTVVRHRTIPKRPARLDGELVVLVDGFETVALSLSKESMEIGVRMSPDGVYKLTPGGPCEKSGIRVGDVIVSVNGRKAKDQENAYDLLKSAAVGTISLEVRRKRDTISDEQEAALTAELAKHGAVENVRREPGRLRVRLASHAAAEAAAAAGVAGAVAVFPFWNDRDYEVRP